MEGRDKQNCGTGWSSWISDSVALLGLGKDGMLSIDDRSDCLDAVPVPGEAESCESDGSDGRPCSWKAFQADKVGELGVSEARRV